MMIKRLFGKYEYVLFFTTVFLCAFGLLLLYSASSYYCINNYQNEYYLVIRQGAFIIAGLIVLIIISFIPYQIFLKSSFIIYMGSLFLVLLTFFAGVASRGSTRWVDINGIIFQPSELMKIGIILHLSSLCGKFIENKDRYDEIKYQKEYYKILATGLLPSMVISVANLSTGIICVFITFCYAFLISKKRFVFLIIILLIASVFFFKYPIALIIEKIGILKKYQMNRILAWVSPKEYEDVAYQTNQSLYAIGSGGIWGRGIGESLQKMIIPEAQNDMIFAILVEETGVVGALFFIFMYVMLIGRIIYISQREGNIHKTFVLVGVGMHLFIQVVLNISVCLNIIPNTGVILPFVSYGGTSLMVSLFEIGLCMSLSK